MSAPTPKDAALFIESPVESGTMTAVFALPEHKSAASVFSMDLS